MRFFASLRMILGEGLAMTVRSGTFEFVAKLPPISVKYKMERLIEFEGYEAYNEFMYQTAGGAEMKKLSLLFVAVISIVFIVSCVTKEVPVTETYYETEYKTEYRTETYTETEDVVVSTSEGKTYPTLVSEWQTGMYFKAEGSGTGMTYYSGYEIDGNEHAQSEVKIRISSMAKGYIGVYNLTGVGQIPPQPELRGSRAPTASGEASLLPVEQEWFDNLNAIVTDPQRVLSLEPMGNGQEEIAFDAKGIEEFAILANSWNKNCISSVKLVWPEDIVEKRIVTKERQVPYQVPVQVEKQRTVTKTEKVPFWEAWKANPPAATEPSSPSTTEAEPVVIETSSNVTTTEASPVTINDDFSNPNSGWGRSSDDWGEYAYEEGEYSISLERTDWFGYHLNSVSGMLEDFTVEVDAKKLSQGTDDAAGIIFRDQRGQGKDSFYVFWVDSKHGTYAIQKYIEDVWAPNLKDFTSSNYIQRGANTNRLKVVCKGSQIEVYANDNKLTTVIDSSLTSGFIGLAAETFTSSNAHYHFDNFKLHTNSH
jgi:hypothetical protein